MQRVRKENSNSKLELSIVLNDFRSNFQMHQKPRIQTDV